MWENNGSGGDKVTNYMYAVGLIAMVSNSYS